jgi:pSer/pThr/pTyr-binding forkhead associated (FHA) protein
MDVTQRVATLELANGVSFSLSENQFPVSIGRDSKNDICIDLRQVSRRHCELHLVNGQLRVRDLSKNGTLVDNRRLLQGSMLIDQPTTLELAADLKIVIAPSDEMDADLERRQDYRRQERRVEKRRVMAEVVGLDRRADFTRRGMERREAMRHSDGGVPA